MHIHPTNTHHRLITTLATTLILLISGGGIVSADPAGPGIITPKHKWVQQLPNGYLKALHYDINMTRLHNWRHPLIIDDDLNKIAYAWSRKQAFYDHMEYNEAAIGELGEILAKVRVKNPPEPNKVVKKWMTSRRNGARILSPTFKSIGYGYTTKNGWAYIVVNFSNKNPFIPTIDLNLPF